MVTEQTIKSRKERIKSNWIKTGRYFSLLVDFKLKVSLAGGNTILSKLSEDGEEWEYVMDLDNDKNWNKLSASFERDYLGTKEIDVNGILIRKEEGKIKIYSRNITKKVNGIYPETLVFEIEAKK